VGSLHPLYAEKDLIYDPAILGVWTGVDGENETWTIQCESEPGKSYRIIGKKEDKNVGEYVGHLVCIKGNKFLDIVQDKSKDEDINNNVFAVPLHVFVQVRNAGEDHEVRLLDYDWLKAYLKKRTGVVKHEVVNDDLIVLTAKPRGLQRFVLRHLKDGFSDWQVVKRFPEKS
jgi:hypothetical protein